MPLRHGMTALTLLAAALATAASAASDSSSRRIRIRWEVYPSLGPAFVDPQESVPPTNILTVLREVEQTGPPVRSRNPELAEDRLVVRAYDTEGTQLFQSVIADPRVLRAESADLEGRLAGRVLHRRVVEFDVVLPGDLPTAQLRFFHPRWTGNGWELDPVGKPVGIAVLGAPPAPPAPPPPGANASRPVTTVVDNGDPQRRVDLAILGDGYTAGQTRKYASDVDALCKAIFAQAPLSEYRRYFNVHRVDVESAQSGADHPSQNKYVDTALDASFGCNDIERLICVNQSAVNAIVGDSLSPARADLVLVLVNDSEYGGSGGAIAVASTHPKVVELVLHEAGHRFGSLADEYGGPPPPSCFDKIEPSEPNVTREAQRTNAKWNLWISSSPSTRAACDQPGVPTVCPGARYCDSTLYRPTHDSKMRTLGSPFDPINGEQLVKRIYSIVLPIDSSSPDSDTLTLDPGQKQMFTVTSPQPSTHSLRVTWKVDGEQRATTTQFTLVAPPTPGVHTVTVSVEDPTTMVRNDPGDLLKASRSWTVTVQATPP